MSTATAKTWYSFRAAAGADTADVSVFDFIGNYGVSAIDFLRDLKNIDAPNIRVLINSPGGDVFQAIAMYNGLRLSGKRITTQVMGIAASAASYIMLAGDHRVMPDNTMQMVHNASTGAHGNAEELNAAAEALKTVDRNLHATYAKRTGLSAAKVKELLSEDTFLTAAECKELGLCDEVIPAVRLTAAFDVDRLPKNVRDLFAMPAPLADQVRTLARRHGMEAHAALFVADSTITSAAEAEIAIARGKEIVALARVAGLPRFADRLIRERKTTTEARVELMMALVDHDEATAIDTATRSKVVLGAQRVDDWSPAQQWAAIKAMTAGGKK